LIGRVGRLEPVKGYPLFLTAAAEVARSRAATRFVCVGSGPDDYARWLRDQAQALGLAERLVWAGARADMPAVYSALDVAVSTSEREGFPNVVAEAMACGVPCVVTDVGDSARIVGEYGEVVPPGDPAAMSAAMGRLLDDRERGAIDRARVRERIVGHFSHASLIEGTERALAALLEERPPC